MLELVLIVPVCGGRLGGPLSNVSYAFNQPPHSHGTVSYNFTLIQAQEDTDSVKLLHPKHLEGGRRKGGRGREGGRKGGRQGGRLARLAD